MILISEISIGSEYDETFITLPTLIGIVVVIYLLYNLIKE